MVHKYNVGGVWQSKQGELPALFLSQVDDEITFLQTDVLSAPASEFRRQFRHDPKGLTVPTAKLLYEWGRGHLASALFFEKLRPFLPTGYHNEETLPLATTPKKKEAAPKTAAAKKEKAAAPKAAAKPAQAAPEKTPVGDGLGRENTVAGFMKRAIMAGEKSDAEILDEASKRFGFDKDAKKTYVGFYRRQLRQKGLNPPEPMKKAA